MSAISEPRHVDYYKPYQNHTRPGCPCCPTPTYQIIKAVPGQHPQKIHEYTTMTLAHQSKENDNKNLLPLKQIHHKLEASSLSLHQSGSSNILLSTISFNCLIKTSSDIAIREFIYFDLRIPGTNTEKEVVFSYDFVANAYGGKTALYAAIKKFYKLGRQTANSDNSRHGHNPKYDPAQSLHDQYIRHTEQMLVAYLALPEASEMLYRRLKVELRSKYADICKVKIYNIGLHMHSTKTCCGPCEYTLVGLMNAHEAIAQNNKQLSLLYNFEQSCAEPNDVVEFTFPQNKPLSLVVTVSAHSNDADHKKKISYKKTEKKLSDPIPSFLIPITNPNTSQQIYLAQFDLGDRSPSSPNLGDKSVAISGSKATPNSKSTINKVKQLRSKTSSPPPQLLFPDIGG